ncbi:5'-nucleotidase [uncultured Rikenella sp.]|uniref:5'-nucleotidase n=1 Tax=uncultured Rikenella sp. TaxID=368003 RepID=UPI0025F21CA8|nr:5'-nucleotidase [uncultured Rikenella sp.]
MMRRVVISLFFSLLSVLVSAQSHRRLVVTAGDAATMDFDPVTGRYRAGSLTAVARFVETWQAELGEASVFAVDIPRRKMPLGDAVYAALVDSTLRPRVMQAAGYLSAAAGDSLAAQFGVTPAAVDSLGEHEWLVADRYEIDGHTAVRVRRYDFSDIRPSKSLKERFAADEKRMRRFFLELVAKLDTAITTRDGFFGPSAFADLFHRFQLSSAPGADVSFFAPPAMDVTLPAGDLSLSDILPLFRFDNRLVVVRLPGRRLKEWIEKIFGMRFFRIAGPQSDLVRLKVPYYLHDDVAGLRFRVDLTARPGHRVTIYETECGEPFDPDRTYTLVLNSFRARELQNEGWPVTVVAEDYRVALAAWLTAQETLSPRARDNWSAGPERWVRAIAVRERRTIFSEK